MSFSRAIQFGLIADGPSDDALLPILIWAIAQLSTRTPLRRPLFFPRRPPGSELAGFIDKVLTNYSNLDVLFVHRDAEGIASDVRRREIPSLPKLVPVVPVRMTEAWLLIDEVALRRAAGNPNGRAPLDMPNLHRLEGLSDPKVTLRELLISASEFKGRRRQQFSADGAARRVADHIKDFSPLRRLSAFQNLERDLAIAWKELDT